MRLLHRERIVPLALLLGIGGVLPVALLLGVGHHMVMFGMAVHFVGVGVSALCATAVSLALTIVGVRRNDGRVVVIVRLFLVLC
jgi:drug/metabolite transporter (DMT)-like permease